MSRAKIALNLVCPLLHRSMSPFTPGCCVWPIFSKSDCPFRLSLYKLCANKGGVSHVKRTPSRVYVCRFPTFWQFLAELLSASNNTSLKLLSGCECLSHPSKLCSVYSTLRFTWSTFANGLVLRFRSPYVWTTHWTPVTKGGRIGGRAAPLLIYCHCSGV